MASVDNSIDWTCTVEDGVINTELERRQCWRDFVEAFSILNTSGQPATEDDYRSNSFYFMPACYGHQLGGTGGQNFGILAKIPVLVNQTLSSAAARTRARAPSGPGKHLGPVHGAGSVYGPVCLANTTDRSPRKTATQPSRSSGTMTGNSRGNQT